MKRLSEILVVFGFVLFIGLAGIFTATNHGETYFYYENRLYAPFPEASVENVLDGDFMGQLERFLCDRSAGRQLLLKVKTAADINLGRPVVNDVVVQDDLYLPYVKHETVNAEDIAQQAAVIGESNGQLREQIEGYGGHYYYVAVPCQYVCYEDRYPTYLNNRSEYTALELEALHGEMDKHGVHMIDMLPIYKQMQEQYATDANEEEPLFYSSKIDNHYGLYGAYALYQVLIETINEDTNYNLYLPAGDDLIWSQVETPYMGSRTRKLMGVIPSEERLLQLEFKKPVPFKKYDNGVQVESSVYSTWAVENGHVTYAYYMGGDQAEARIDTNRPHLPSVLVYGDSFTNALETMLYYSFDEMRSIDLRHYKEMSLSDYIAKYKPDVVICIRDYEALLAASGNGDLFQKQP